MPPDLRERESEEGRGEREGPAAQSPGAIVRENIGGSPVQAQSIVEQDKKKTERDRKRETGEEERQGREGGGEIER